MENFLVCLNAVLPVFLLMLVGYAAKCLGFLDRGDVKKLNALMFRMFLPVLLFYNIYSSDLSSAIRPRLLAYALAAVLAEFALSALFARFAVKERGKRSVVIQGIYRSNFVMIGLPIVKSLMGDVDLGPVAVLLATVVPLYNVLAVIVLEYYNGEKPRPGKMVLDILKNPLILGSAAAVLALLLRLRLPAAVLTVAQEMAQVSSAFMLVLLGAFFRFDGLRRHVKELAMIVVGRLIAAPGIFLGLAAALGFRGLELAALLGVFASANATTSFPMAQQMGGDAELAGDAVVATSAVCSFTLFFWCLLFKNLGLF
ncbi:MAG: AEC family transporter [Oscillospiraceae bacterium]|nr:AEC family transporter [Oscillospiraceae bacterium]